MWNKHVSVCIHYSICGYLCIYNCGIAHSIACQLFKRVIGDNVSGQSPSSPEDGCRIFRMRRALVARCCAPVAHFTTVVAHLQGVAAALSLLLKLDSGVTTTHGYTPLTTPVITSYVSSPSEDERRWSAGPSCWLRAINCYLSISTAIKLTN